MYPAIHKILNFCIAAIWLLNGLYCKVLNYVPRHELIVGRILGQQHAPLFTRLIGVAEILMAAWVLSGIKPRLNAWVQILLVATMNTIEFLLARDILLFGKGNAILAAILIVAIYTNTFIVYKRISSKS